MISDRLRAHIAMLVTAVIWGTAFTIMKLALREVSPLEMTLLRYTIAAAGFIVVVLGLRRNFLSIRRGDWPRTFVSAILGIVAYGMLVNVGLQNSPSGVAGLMNTAVPIFTLILSVIFLNEALTRNKVIGIGIAICGVVLIVLRGSGEADFNIASVVGPLIIAAAMFSWSLYAILAKPLLANYSPISFTACVMVIGAILMMPSGMAVDWSGLALASPIVWIAAAFAGLGSTLIGQLLYNYSLTTLDASEVAVYLYLVPVTTVISAMLLLGEGINVYFVFGAVMIVFGVALANRARNASISAPAHRSPPGVEPHMAGVQRSSEN